MRKYVQYLRTNFLFRTYFKGRKAKLSVFNYLSTVPWRLMGEWGYGSTIYKLGTRWRRWVVSFMPRPFYSRRKSPNLPLDRRLCGSQSRSGCYGVEKNVAPAGNRTQTVQPVAHRCSDWAIPNPHILRVALKRRTISDRLYHVSEFPVLRLDLTCTVLCMGSLPLMIESKSQFWSRVSLPLVRMSFFPKFVKEFTMEFYWYCSVSKLRKLVEFLIQCYI
jgi:hypothetical protein